MDPREMRHVSKAFALWLFDLALHCFLKMSMKSSRALLTLSLLLLWVLSLVEALYINTFFFFFFLNAYNQSVTAAKDLMTTVWILARPLWSLDHSRLISLL